MSAAAALAGLYPPTPSQTWNPDLPWFPIPIHARHLYKDRVLNVSIECPLRNELKRQAAATDWGRDFLRENMFLIQTIANNTGFTNPEYIMTGFNYVCTLEQKNNLTWAHWITEEICEKSQELLVFYYKATVYHPELLQIAVGRLMSQIIESMRNASTFVKTPNLYLYSVHDISMIAFLEAVGIKFTGWVPYFGSCLILELHEIGAGQFFTELWIFNNTEDGLADNATQIPIPGCVQPCSLDDFVRIVSPIVLETDEEHERLCLSTQQNGIGIELQTFILVIICLIAIFATASVGVHLSRRRHPPGLVSVTL